MEKRPGLVGLTAIVVAIWAASSALAAPALSVTPEKGHAGTTPMVITGSGFAPGDAVELTWQTWEGNRVSGSGFVQIVEPLATVTADSTGAIRLETVTPWDLGGPAHPIQAKVAGTVIAETNFTIERTATITPTSGPLGKTITLHMTGGGWTQYDNIVAVTYDNAFIGFMCSFNSQGNMTLWLPASGGVGLHIIDVWPALYYGSNPGPTPWKIAHLSDGDQPWAVPKFHFEFTITDLNGTVPQSTGSGVASGDDSLGGAFLGLTAVAAVVAVGLEVPIRQTQRKARGPAAAVALLMMVGGLAIIGLPAGVSAGEPASDPPLFFMAAAGEPTLGLSTGLAPPASDYTIQGAGFAPGAAISLTWSTVSARTETYKDKNKGWNITPEVRPLATVTADSSGSFSLAQKVPFDFGGDHTITAMVGGSALAATALRIQPWFEFIGPAHVKAGEKVTVRGYGLGYEQYTSVWSVLYDNHLTGWVSAFEKRGNVTFEIYAIGAAGAHYIDIHEGSNGWPYLNLWESPWPWEPAQHFSFVIDPSGAVPPPQVASGSSPSAWILPLGAGVAVGAVAVQAVRVMSASRATRVSKPTKP